MPFYRRGTQPPPTPLLEPPGNQTNSRGLIYLAVFGLCAGWLLHSCIGKVPESPPGVITAGQEPQQVLMTLHAFQVGDYTLTPLAQFSIRARVLSTERYSYDREADLSPVDFALGWGKMSDSAVLQYLDISQSGRWYYWHYQTQPPVSDLYIIAHSGNMHILPATPAIAELAKSVRTNHVVSMQGYLVGITGKDDYKWTSSLSREDSGSHSCEVFWVTSLVIEK